jgi:hypothetical protein
MHTKKALTDKELGLCTAAHCVSGRRLFWHCDVRQKREASIHSTASRNVLAIPTQLNRLKMIFTSLFQCGLHTNNLSTEKDCFVAIKRSLRLQKATNIPLPHQQPLLDAATSRWTFFALPPKAIEALAGTRQNVTARTKDRKEILDQIDIFRSTNCLFHVAVIGQVRSPS